MKYALIRLLGLLLLTLAPAAALSVSGSTTEREIFVKRFGDVTIHTYVAGADGEGTATHAIETPNSLFVIDTHLLRKYAQDFESYLMGIDKPVSHVLISHAHPDHYYGVETFWKYPTFATHDTMMDIGGMEWLRDRSWKAYKEQAGDALTDIVSYPQETIKEGIYSLDGLSIEIITVRNAEDAAQTVVLIPSLEVAIVQDLAANLYHSFTGNEQLEGWIAVLDDMLGAKSIRYIFAGHGEPGGKEILMQTMEYLKFTQNTIRTSFTRKEFADKMKRRYPHFGGQLFLDISSEYHFLR